MLKKDKKKSVLSRKRIVKSFMFIMAIAYCLGFFMYDMCSDFVSGNINGYAQPIIDIRLLQLVFLVLFPLVTLIMWLPLFLAGAQVYDLNEEGILMVPVYKDRQKWKMIFHVLASDDVKPYLQQIYFKDVNHILFTVDRHVGLWAMSRYSYVLKVYDAKGLMTTLFINPMENGLLMPSGKGGVPITGYKSRDEIYNMMRFLITNGVKVVDPYHIIDALKNHDVEVYDYLESLNIKVRY